MPQLSDGGAPAGHNLPLVGVPCHSALIPAVGWARAPEATQLSRRAVHAGAGPEWQPWQRG
jgi:hypothetical protein